MSCRCPGNSSPSMLSEKSSEPPEKCSFVIVFITFPHFYPFGMHGKPCDHSFRIPCPILVPEQVWLCEAFCGSNKPFYFVATFDYCQYPSAKCVYPFDNLSGISAINPDQLQSKKLAQRMHSRELCTMSRPGVPTTVWRLRHLTFLSGS
jgi:hypothetical protein